MNALMLVFFLGALALVVALYVLIGVFVYKDAQRRGMNAVLWTVVAVLVPSFIGVIVYLLARNSMPEGKLCAKCNAPVEESFMVCPKCGYELAIPCPACGKQVSREWRLCPYCKAELPSPQPAVKTARRMSPGLIAAIVVLAVLVCVCLFGGLFALPYFTTHSSGVQIGMVENNMHTNFSGDFSYFDGERSHDIQLEKGQTLTIKADIGVLGGSIATDVTDPSGMVLKQVDGNFTDIIVVTADQTGNYTIHLKLDKAKGHYKFSWTIQ